MINNEFDDYFSLLGNDYDDNIIELYPFAEAFGTPDMFRPDKSRRYDEEELEKQLESEISCSKDELNTKITNVINKLRTCGVLNECV